jgi:hypothetical protein
MSRYRIAWTVALALSLASGALAQTSPAVNPLEQQRIDRVWNQSWREFAAYYLEHNNRFICFTSYDRTRPNSRGITARDYSRQSTREFTARDERGREVQRTFTKPQGEVDLITKALPDTAPGEYGFIHSGMIESIDGPDSMTLRDVWLIDPEKVRVERDAAREEFRRQYGRDVDDAFRDRRRGMGFMERFDAYRAQLDWQFEQRDRALRRQGRQSHQTWRVIGFDTRNLVTGQRWPAGGGTGGEGVAVAVVGVEGDTIFVVPASRLGRGVNEEQFKKALEQRGLTVDRFVQIVTDQKRTNPMRYRDAVLATIEGKSLEDPAQAVNTEIREFAGE